jgi:hypothetical protein
MGYWATVISISRQFGLGYERVEKPSHPNPNDIKIL